MSPRMNHEHYCEDCERDFGCDGLLIDTDDRGGMRCDRENETRCDACEAHEAHREPPEPDLNAVSASERNESAYDAYDRQRGK